MGAPISRLDPQALGFVPGEGRDKNIRQLVAGGQRVSVCSCGDIVLRMPQKARHDARSNTDHRAIDHCEIDIIDHEQLMSEALAIFLSQLPGKTFVVHGQSWERLPSADDVHPQGKVRTRDIAQGDVEPLVPVVKILIVCALEADSAKTDGLDVVAGIGADDVLANLGRVWDMPRS